VNKIIVAVVAVLLLGGGAYYFFGIKKGTKAADPQVPTSAKVERGSLRLSVASTGKVVPNFEVDIKCKASGETIKLPYDISDVVKKNELLLELDPKDQKRILEQSNVQLSASQARLQIAQENLKIAERTLATDRRRAESSLQSAEQKLKDARSKANRLKQLLQKQMSSQEESETAETAAIQSEADLENARVKLDELKTQEEALELSRQQVKLAEAQVASDKISNSVSTDRLNDTKVFAPMDGVVTDRKVQIGQIIASAVSNVGGGTTVLTLSDLSQIFVIAAVDESDIGKVQLGQKVEISADAYPGKILPGKVVRIATKGVNQSNVVTFEVKIEVMSSEKSLLKPEMTTNVEIVGQVKENVLMVPVEALSRKGNKQHMVSIPKADGTNEERVVQMGITDGVKTEIVSGLAEGETVALRKGAGESRWNAGGRPGFPGGMPGMGGRR